MTISVGHEFEPFEFIVKKSKTGEFASAIGDKLHPLGEAFEAPLGYVFFVTVQNTAEMFAEMGFQWKETLYGGTESEFRKPILTGMHLTGKTIFKSYNERETENSRLGIAILETRYFDQNGEELLLEKSSIIIRGGRHEEFDKAGGDDNGR